MGKQLALVDANGAHAREARVVRKVKRYRKWHGKFLRSLAKSPSVSLAAQQAGISRRSAYNAREADPEFAEAWDDALNQSVDTLEHSIYQRALKDDSQLAMFILKAFRPFYRESSRMELDARVCGVLVLPQKESKEP